MTRIKNLQSRLPENVDCLLVTNEKNQRYLTGLNYTDGYVVVGKEKAFLLADFRYIEVAKRHESDELTVIMLERNVLNNVIRNNGFKNVGFESGSMTVSSLEGLKKAFSDINFISCGGIIEEMRVSKTEDEVENTIKAQRIAEQALERLFTFMKPDMTEIEVALELDYGMRKFGAEKPGFDTIAVSGTASSLPHGEPRNIKLEKGFLTMDFGALYNGYCSDMTRTIVIGKADDEMKKIYNTVLKAQLAALDYVEAGKIGKDCDKVARDIINGEGYEGCFGHSLGHGVGMYIHENPRLASIWDKPLEVGAIVTVEPGIYIEGKYGVRIEDMVWLGANGTVNLTKAPKELIEMF